MLSDTSGTKFWLSKLTLVGSETTFQDEKDTLMRRPERLS